MMQDYTPADWLFEVNESRAEVSKHLGDLEDDEMKFAGMGYSSEYPRDISHSDIVNNAQRWRAVVLPKILVRAENVRVRTRRPGAQRMRAIALQGALHRWAVETDVMSLQEELGHQFSVRWAACKVLKEPAPGQWQYEDPTWWPQATPLSLRMFGWDHHATRRQGCQFFWDLIVRDKEDFLQEAREHPERGWDEEVIEGMTPTDEVEQARGDDSYRRRRPMVGYYSIWCPSLEFNDKGEIGKRGKKYTPERFSNGGTLTIPVGGSRQPSDAWLRPPRPFIGPRTGPYVFAGDQIVLDHVAPLGPIPAGEVQSNNINSIARAICDASAQRKVVGVIGYDVGELQEVLVGGQHLGIYKAPGVQDLAKNFAQVPLGGADATQFAAYNLFMQQYQEAVGLQDAAIGNVQGVGTATEVVTAQNAANTRFGKSADKFRSQVVRQIFKTVAAYMLSDPDVSMPVDVRRLQAFVDERTGQIAPFPVLRGGIEKKGAGGKSRWERYDLSDEYEVEFSFPGDPQTQNEVAAITHGVQLAPMIAQLPGLPWEDWLRRLDDSYGVIDVLSGINVTALQEFQAMMMQMQMGQGGAGAQQQPEPAEAPQPKLVQEITVRPRFSPTTGSKSSGPKTAGANGLGGKA